MSSSSEYRGPERRRRITYMTRNTEYHLEGGVCVAVRDRATGNWQLCHHALGHRLRGAVTQKPGHEPCAKLEAPEIGDALYFATDIAEGSEILTSHLLSVERPKKTTVLAYPV